MESPDNDSAFESDDISLMSSESSASSGSGMISGGARWVRQVRLMNSFVPSSFCAKMVILKLNFFYHNLKSENPFLKLREKKLRIQDAPIVSFKIK
jgi:hypothetical protein